MQGCALSFNDPQPKQRPWPCDPLHSSPCGCAAGRASRLYQLYRTMIGVVRIWGIGYAYAAPKPEPEVLLLVQATPN